MAVISEEIGFLSAETGVRMDVSSRSISGPLIEATPWLQVAGHMSGSELVEVIVRGIEEDEHDGRLAIRIRDEVTEIVHSHNALGEWSSDGPILHLVVEVLFAASDADYR